MRRALALLLALLFAGCTATQPEEDAPPRVVSRAEDSSLLRLVSFALSADEVEAGQNVTAIAQVANDGSLSALAEVRFELSGGPRATASERVPPGQTREVRAQLSPSVGGNVSVRAQLGAAEAHAALRVLAARVADLQVDLAPTSPCAPLRLAASFHNAGDAPARDVALQLAIMDPEGALLATLRADLGTVAAGERGEATLDAPEVRAACEGAEPAHHAVLLVVRAAGLREAELTRIVTA